MIQDKLRKCANALKIQRRFSNIKKMQNWKIGGLVGFPKMKASIPNIYSRVIVTQNDGAKIPRSFLGDSWKFMQMTMENFSVLLKPWKRK